MNLRSVLPAALFAVLASSTLAQSPDVAPAAQTEEELALTLPTDEWYVPKNTLSFGYRVMTKGANVKFGNLGSVASIRTYSPISDGAVTRVYDTGAVALDAARSDESLPTTVAPTDGTSLAYGVYPGNGRYQVFLSTNVGGNITNTQTADLLSYQAGRTRTWAYNTDAQVANGLVAMSNYSAIGLGNSAEKDEGMNGGLELTFSRLMGKIGRKTEWSISAGLGINTVNAKTSGTVTATLVTRTDYFQLNGPTPSSRGGPTYADLTLPDSTVVTSGLETTTTVNDIPVSTTLTTTVGGATVQGNWKIKGAYFLAKFGPSIHTQITERWGIGASIGFAAAYSGTTYSVVEELVIPDVTNPITEEPTNTETKVLTGFYADLNVDWAATERTGLFAGAAMQSLGSYDQTVSGRTAKIDFGSNMGIRGGVNIKF